LLEKYIEELSIRDKKTLPEKIAKLFEEGGELAKASLPYSGVYTTNHRITDKKDILEECVDTYLVAKSIAYSLGFSDEEFKKELERKANVWDTLQRKEDHSLEKSDLMLYEIHITVNAETGIDIEEFKKDCKDANVKPIVLALQNQTGEKVMNDVMTSSKLFGHNGEAFDEMKRISNFLFEKGYNVIREKIEAAYWHPKAPFKEFGDTKMPENCYFECHFGVNCNDEVLPILSEIAKETDSHLSKNAFKVNDDGSYTIMLTYRSYTQMYEDFRAQLDYILSLLKKDRFSVEKEVVEFSIYDTKINHDQKWLEAK